jgi:hypothetical protein
VASNLALAPPLAEPGSKWLSSSPEKERAAAEAAALFGELNWEGILTD